MLSRLLVILLAVPILIYVILVGDVTFVIFNMVVIAIAMHEFYKILQKKSIIVYYKTGLILGLSLPIFIYFRKDISFMFKYLKIINTDQISFDMGGFIVFVTLLIAVLQVLKNKIKNSTSELIHTLFGIIYISFFISYMIMIREELPNGNIILLYTFISIWACDTFAYLVGILIGGKIIKKRLSEQISPKKSIEGFFGGILGVFLVGYYFEKMYINIINILNKFEFINIININMILISKNIIKLLILSIFIAIFSVLGDLFESKLKREFGVKDSGNILLGHGGFLDRFDSAIFVLPIVYYFIKYFII